MKKTTVVTVLVVVGLGFVVWWWISLRPNAAPAKAPQSGVSSSEKLPAPAAAAPADLRTKPRMFRSKEFPPRTAEAKAMWDWWNAMDKVDPSFQWKMPIRFYGIVLDQSDHPVAGARVAMVWTTVDGNDERNVESGSDGKFKLEGVQGKRLSVRVLKEGYVRTASVIQSFEYAAFYDNEFYVPEAGKPVVFRLRKLVDPQPMYKYSIDKVVPLSSASIAVDVTTGRVGMGNMYVTFAAHATGAASMPACTIRVRGTEGTAFCATQGEHMFRAPDEGYSSELTFSSQIGSRGEVRARYYARANNGSYAAIEIVSDVRIDHRHPQVGDVGMQMTIYYNPNGSKNLEYDSTRKLNP